MDSVEPVARPQRWMLLWMVLVVAIGSGGFHGCSALATPGAFSSSSPWRCRGSGMHRTTRHRSGALLVGDDEHDSSTDTNPVMTTDPPAAHQPLLDAIASLSSLENDGGDSTDARRVFHGRGGLFPGCDHWTLDWFPPVWLLTSHQEEPEDTVRAIRDALQSKCRELGGDGFHLVYQLRASTTTSSSVLLAGTVPEDHVVTEHGMRFAVKLHDEDPTKNNKNHGIFLDMAHGREWVRNTVTPDSNVLNLFAYTCGFSVAALAGGAQQVVNVDKVRGVLKIGQKNHALNDFLGDQQTVRFLAHDVFKTWGKIRKLGPYDLVVVDPPSYQKGSFVATKDYAKILRRLPGLLGEGGHALLCLNAPERTTAWLKEQVEEEAAGTDDDGAGKLVFVERLPNPPAFASKDPERSLKVLVYRKESDGPTS